MKKLIVDASTGEEFDDIWDALENSPEEAANARAQADMMDQILAIIRQNGWSDAEAATRCGVSSAQMQHLASGHLSEFPLESLVNIATALGRRVRIDLEAA